MCLSVLRSYSIPPHFLSNTSSAGSPTDVRQLSLTNGKQILFFVHNGTAHLSFPDLQSMMPQNLRQVLEKILTTMDFSPDDAKRCVFCWSVVHRPVMQIYSYTGLCGDRMAVDVVSFLVCVSELLELTGISLVHTVSVLMLSSSWHVHLFQE